MAEPQSTECLGCKSSECGLQLKCKHSFCLQCLQKMYNDDQTVRCTVCYAGANKGSISKQRLSVDHSVLDESSVTDHVLIFKEFVVKLTTENCHCNPEYDKDLKIAGKLTSLSFPGNEKDISVVDNHDGTYDLSGCCDKEGEWELRGYVNGMQISQAPLKVKSVKEGLQERPNIFRAKKDTSLYMFDIVDETVYACGGINEIAKFTLKGQLIGTIYGHMSCQFTSLCCVNVEGDLSIACYDENMKKLWIYKKENWLEVQGVKIESVLGKMISHDDKIYVPDYGKHCVLCISMKGELLEKIEGRSYKNVKLSKPHGVAMTKKGDLLVLSYGDERVVKFDKDNMAEIFIENSRLLRYPYAIAIDERGQIIIGCYRKLLLFNEDGKFIKNIDTEKKLADTPFSIFCKNRCLWVSDKTYSSLRLYYY